MFELHGVTMVISFRDDCNRHADCSHLFVRIEVSLFQGNK